VSTSRVVIFANGVLPDPEKLRALLGPHDIFLCANGGTRHALALGIAPAVVIGDLDSLADADRAKLSSAHTRLMQHSHDKDETDLELALVHALSLKPSAILIACGLGRRLDQTLGNIALLADTRLRQIDCRLDDGVEEAFFCWESSEITGTSGDLVSLLPWGKEVTGVRTHGLRWPLDGESLHPERTRGISNEMLAASATVSIQEGLLLVIHRRRSWAGDG